MSVEPEIILDISRLISRALHRNPTGVDRVEMAYAHLLRRNVPDQLRFAAVDGLGLYRRLPFRGAEWFLDRTEERWHHHVHEGARDRHAFAIRVWRSLLGEAQTVKNLDRPRIYFQASPHHQDNTRLVSRILTKERARLISFVHDLIPIEYPEYARPDGSEKHRRRIHTIATLSSGLIANSMATLDSLQRHVGKPLAPARVAHLGLGHLPMPSPSLPGKRPYFVMVATIEPRKNHLLLLNLWRNMVEDGGADTLPELVLIGRRGWENEQIVDMLDRCPALKQCVREIGSASEQQTSDIICGACALLLPSFAEGYGMPVAEAIAFGTPVICSDIPALREAGGDVPEYLHPLDGPGWRDAIAEYAHYGDRRNAQLERMAEWRAPSWDDHLHALLSLCEELTS